MVYWLGGQRTLPTLLRFTKVALGWCDIWRCCRACCRGEPIEAAGSYDQRSRRVARRQAIDRPARRGRGAPGGSACRRSTVIRTSPSLATTLIVSSLRAPNAGDAARPNAAAMVLAFSMTAYPFSDHFRSPGCACRLRKRRSRSLSAVTWWPVTAPAIVATAPLALN
jgi:hypothetical protein